MLVLTQSSQRQAHPRCIHTVAATSHRLLRNWDFSLQHVDSIPTQELL